MFELLRLVVVSISIFIFIGYRWNLLFIVWWSEGNCRGYRFYGIGFFLLGLFLELFGLRVFVVIIYRFDYIEGVCRDYL